MDRASITVDDQIAIRFQADGSGAVGQDVQGLAGDEEPVFPLAACGNRAPLAFPEAGTQKPATGIPSPEPAETIEAEAPILSPPRQRRFAPARRV